MTGRSANPHRDGGARERVRFGPPRVVLLAVVIALIGTLPAAASSPWLLWLLLLPLAAGVWVLRARVVVSRSGMEVCNGLGVVQVAWPQVEGFDVPRRGWVRLLHDGRRTAMTALPRTDLPRLIDVAQRTGGENGEKSLEVT